MELEELVANFMAQRGKQFFGVGFSARSTVNSLAGMGSFRSDATSVNTWDTSQTSRHPNGVVTFNGDGMLTFWLDDLQGWHPFVAVYGIEPQRTVSATIDFAMQGGMVHQTSVSAMFDPNLTMHEAVGPISNGTLAQAGNKARIALTLPDRTGYSVGHAVVGWTKLF